MVAHMLRWLLILPIRFYRRYLSPLAPPACRFTPSCSVYTMQAIDVWGVYGLWLGAKRILRCQPLFPGGHDPVPLPEGFVAPAGGWNAPPPEIGCAHGPHSHP
jgi:uncharacterized protein